MRSIFFILLILITAGCQRTQVTYGAASGTTQDDTQTLDMSRARSPSAVDTDARDETHEESARLSERMQ